MAKSGILGEREIERERAFGVYTDLRSTLLGSFPRCVNITKRRRGKGNTHSKFHIYASSRIGRCSSCTTLKAIRCQILSQGYSPTSLYRMISCRSKLGGLRLNRPFLPTFLTILPPNPYPLHCNMNFWKAPIFCLYQ